MAERCGLLLTDISHIPIHYASINWPARELQMKQGPPGKAIEDFGSGSSNGTNFAK